MRTEQGSTDQLPGAADCWAGGTPESWPLESFLELAAVASSIPCARRHARQVLWEWGFSTFTDTVELLVTELATNALLATRTVSPDLPIRLWLLSDKMRLLVQVWDNHSGLPTRQDTDSDDESGRGLLLVEALSSQWGWYAHQGLGGKVVWFELGVDAPSLWSAEQVSGAGADAFRRSSDTAARDALPLAGTKNPASANGKLPAAQRRGHSAAETA